MTACRHIMEGKLDSLIRGLFRILVKSAKWIINHFGVISGDELLDSSCFLGRNTRLIGHAVHISFLKEAVKGILKRYIIIFTVLSGNSIMWWVYSVDALAVIIIILLYNTRTTGATYWLFSKCAVRRPLRIICLLPKSVFKNFSWAL